MTMTSYEQGFFNKCASVGLSKRAAFSLFRGSRKAREEEEMARNNAEQAEIDAKRQAGLDEMRRRVDAANAQIGDLAGVEPITFRDYWTPGDVDWRIGQLNDDIQWAKNERFGENGWQSRIDAQQDALDLDKLRLANQRRLYSSILPNDPTPAFYKLDSDTANSMKGVVPDGWLDSYKFETDDYDRRRNRVAALKRNVMADRLNASGVPSSIIGDTVSKAIPLRTPGQGMNP